MAIKLDNKNVTNINYNDGTGNKTVNRIIQDGDVVWCRPFSYATGTLPTGVASLTCTRYSTEEPSASTGTVANNGTVYYNDVIYWTATAQTGYSVTVPHGSSSKVTVTGNINGVSASGVQATLNRYAVNIGATTYCKSAYLSTNANATSGYASGTSFDYGATVYLFVELNDNTTQYTYTAQSSWTQIGTSRKYRVTSLTVATSGNTFADVSAVRTVNQYTITWKYLSTYPDTYTTTTAVYKYGDIPGTATPVTGTVPSPSTVTSGNNRKVFANWDSLAAVTGNRTITAEYTLQHYITFTGTRCTISSPSSGWFNHSTTAQNASWNANSNCAFDASGTSSNTTSFTANEPKTVTNTAGYINVTIKATNSTASCPDYFSGKTSWTGYLPYSSQVTWAPATYYSFDAGATQTSTTENVTVAGGTYNKTPGNIRAASISKGTYNASVNINANTYYASGTNVTWTASTNYGYSNTGTVTYSTPLTAGGTFSKEPTYANCTVTPTRCTASQSSGWLAIGSDITYTHNTDYSYTETVSSPTNPTKHTVSLGTLSYARSCDYKNITVSGTNCSANIATGYRLIGATITWTAGTDTNLKYSFANSSITTPVTTDTATISTSTAAYSKTAGYKYYNITITKNSGTATATYNTGSTVATSGYTLENTKIRFTATANATNTKYSYSNSSADTHYIDYTVSSAGQTISSPTVYTWYNVTITPATNSTASASTGYNLSGTLVTFTATTATSSVRYSFSSTASDQYTYSDSTATSGTKVDSAGKTIAGPTVYTWYNITVTSTNCSATVSSGWRQEGTAISWTPNTYYSFESGSTQQSKVVTVDAAGTYTGDPGYIKAKSITGTHCSANKNASTYYAKGTVITWTADTNYGFDSSGTSTSTANLEAGVDHSKATTHVNVTSVTGTHCTPYTSTAYSTQFTTGWKANGTTIYWKAATGYCFNQSTNAETTTATVVAGSNNKSTDLLKRYVLTISVTGADYGDYAVKRGTTTLSNGDYIYYGDTLTGESSAHSIYYGAWDVTSVTKPTYTSTGASTSGNLTVMNKDSHTATLFYNTTNATGGTSLGEAAQNATKTVSGLEFGTDYYISARVARTRTKYTPTKGTCYTGTSSVTGNVTASFNFTCPTSADNGTIFSDVVKATTATINPYTITWKYRDAYDSWTTTTQTYNYGQTPSRSAPSTVTSGNYRRRVNTESYTNGWNDLSPVVADRTITCQYIDQVYITFSGTRCSCTSHSTNWYDTTSSSVNSTWKASTNCSFGGTTTADTSTVAFVANEPKTVSASANYIYVTISATNSKATCTGYFTNQTSWSGILPYNSQVTWSPNTYYSFDAGTTQTSTAANITSVGGTYSKEPTNYMAKSIATGSYNASVNKDTSHYYAANTQIVWTAGSNYSYDGTTAGDTSVNKVSTKVVAGADISAPNPGYVKCTITPTRCTANKTSGSILAVGTDITFTHSTGYSYTERSAGQDPTDPTKLTVALGTTSYARSCNYKSVTITGTHCTPSPTSGYRLLNSTITWTAETGYHFGSNRSTTTTTETLVDSTSSYSKEATINAYTVTVNRSYQAITGIQSYSETATADTVWTTTVNYGGSYSHTYSKTGYTSQTASSNSVTSDITTSLTLLPTQYSLTVSGNSNWSGGWYTNSSYTGSTISWRYYGYAAYFRATPNSRYEATVGGNRYYNGLYYTTSAGATSTSTTTASLNNATAITYTATISLGNTVVTVGTSTSSYSSSITGTYATLSPSSYKVYFKIDPNSHYEMTVSSTRYYHGSPLSGSSYYITGNNFTFSDSAKTATYALSTATYPVNAITYRATVSASNSTCTLGTTSGSYSSYVDLTYQSKTVYLKQAPSQHYEVTYSSTRYYYNNNYTTSVNYNTFTFNDATSTASYSLTACSATTYSWTVTSSNSAYCYFLEGTSGTPTASTAISKTYSALDTGLRYKINPAAYYEIIDGSSRYYNGSPITANIGKASFTFNYANKTATYARNCTGIKYTISGTSSNGTVYWATSDISASGGSTSLTNVSYGATVYYRIDANTGYDRPVTYYGSLAVNTTNFSVSDANKTATKTMSACSIQTCTVTWRYLSAYPDTWTSTTTTVNYNATPTAPVTPGTVTNSSNNERKTGGSFPSQSKIAADERTRTVTATGYTTQVNCTFSGTNCTANRSNGWLAVGTSITWTGNTGTNLKYSFANTPEKDPTDAQRQTSGGTVATGTYTYSATANYVYYNVTISPTSGYTANKTSGYYINGATITFTAPDNSTTKRYSFSTSDSNVHTQPKYVSSAGQTISNDAASIWWYVKISATNSTAHKGSASGTAITSGSSDWYINNQTITWTPATNYSFAAGTSQSNSSTTISSASDLAASPSYGYVTVTKTRCSGIDTGYRTIGNTTFTANTNCAYSSDGTTTTETKAVTAGGTITSSANYIYVTINSESYTSKNKSTGWYEYNTTQCTYTANTNYAFDSSGTTTKTTSKFTTPGGTYSCPSSITHAYLTVPASGTNCTKTSGTTSSGWKTLGSYTANYTANTNYAFDSSGTTTKDSASVSVPGTITPPTITHAYLTVPSSGTNCTKTSGTTASGWKTLGSYTANYTANSNYAFDSSGTTTKDSASVSVPGTITPPTVTHAYLTVPATGTNCTAVSGTTTSGWKTLGSYTAVYGADDDYAFDSNGLQLQTSASVSVPGTITPPTVTHGKLTVSKGNCTANYSTSWQTLGSYTVTFTANAGWSFGGSAEQDTLDVGPYSLPYTFSASPSYFYLTIGGSNNASITKNGTSTAISSDWYTSSTKPSSITWTPANYYSYDAGTTQTSKTVSSIPSSPATYSNSPTNYKLGSISGECCTWNRDTSHYYAAGTYITATTNDAFHAFNYDLHSGATYTDTTIITAGKIIDFSPTWFNITGFELTRCTNTAGSTGWQNIGGRAVSGGTDLEFTTTQTYYAFGILKPRVTSLPDTILTTLDLAIIGANVGVVFGFLWSPSLVDNQGKLHISANYNIATITQNYISTIIPDPLSATTSLKPLAYTYLYTIGASYICTALTGYAYSSDGGTTTAVYTMDDQQHNNVLTALNWNPTYVNVTGYSGTHCSTTAGTGWRAIIDKISWTADLNYSFNSGNSRTATHNKTPTVGINRDSAQYAYAPITATNCTYIIERSADSGSTWTDVTSVSSANKTYKMVDYLYRVTFTANTGYSFGGITEGDSITVPSSSGTTIPYTTGFVGNPGYCYITVNGTVGVKSITVGGTTRNSGWSGFVTPNTQIVWEALNYYVNSVGIITTYIYNEYSFWGIQAGDSVTEVVSGPATFTHSPGYVMLSFGHNGQPGATGSTSLNNCTYSSGTNWGFYPIGTSYSTIFDANLGWAFDFIERLDGVETTKDYSGTLDGPTYLGVSAYWANLSITALNTKRTEVWKKPTSVGSWSLDASNVPNYWIDTSIFSASYKVIYTANTNWSYGGSTTEDDYTVNVNKSSLPYEVVGSPGYCYITISATNCKATCSGYFTNQTSGSYIVPNGATINWTANTGYALTGSSTVTVTGPGTYSNSAIINPPLDLMMCFEPSESLLIIDSLGQVSMDGNFFTFDHWDPYGATSRTGMYIPPDQSSLPIQAKVNWLYDYATDENDQAELNITCDGDTIGTFSLGATTGSLYTGLRVTGYRLDIIYPAGPAVVASYEINSTTPVTIPILRSQVNYVYKWTIYMTAVARCNFNIYWTPNTYSLATTSNTVTDLPYYAPDQYYSNGWYGYWTDIPAYFEIRKKSDGSGIELRNPYTYETCSVYSTHFTNKNIWLANGSDGAYLTTSWVKISDAVWAYDGATLDLRIGL